MFSNNDLIGVFDFGIGGFLVVNVIFSFFFREGMYYFVDIGCVFYGFCLW